MDLAGIIIAVAALITASGGWIGLRYKASDNQVLALDKQVERLIQKVEDLQRQLTACEQKCDDTTREYHLLLQQFAKQQARQ